MGEIKVIELDEANVATNDQEAAKLRRELNSMGVFMINVMGAPGSGKTEVLAQTVPRLEGAFHVGCMCTDLDTTLDAERVAEVCDHVVQFHTGGMWPYVSAEGSRMGLMELISEDVNVVLLENLGVLISAAAWDTGASMNVVVVSAAGGVYTPLKYSYMFTLADVVLINKSDLADAAGFDFAKCMSNIRRINTSAQIFTISGKTGDGMDAWAKWLKDWIHLRAGRGRA